MATFTIMLKDVHRIVDGDIGLDEYPIFDEAYRAGLNQKILDHYWNQEIGQETIDMWRHAMRRKMNEIMPYYNQLYKSELLKVDPFLTFDSSSENMLSGTQKTVSEASSTAESESGSVGKSRTVASDFPQTRLADDSDYATSAQDAVSDSAATSTAQDGSQSVQDGTQAQDSRSKSTGFSGAMSGLLVQYRQTFLNVDLMVIEDLTDLFMQIWNTGESYNSRGQTFFGYPYIYGGLW